MIANIETERLKFDKHYFDLSYRIQHAFVKFHEIQ